MIYLLLIPLYFAGQFATLLLAARKNRQMRKPVLLDGDDWGASFFWPVILLVVIVFRAIDLIRESITNLIRWIVVPEEQE